jgi:catechol 2,3-dioxygenase-like lactoylglutathione lyase family enzyme
MAGAHGRVTGIGGVFFKAKGDSSALRNWYVEHLRVPDPVHETVLFRWRDEADASRQGYTVWAPFERDTDYFGPSDQTWMTNFRVDDLDAMLERLAVEGVKIAEERDDSEFGRFAWVFDPDGNRIELWEPPPES